MSRKVPPLAPSGRRFVSLFADYTNLDVRNLRPRWGEGRAGRTRISTLPRVIPSAALADAQLPDFSQLPGVTAVAVIVSILFGVFELARGRSRTEAQATAFVGLLIGGSAGFLFYLALLIEGLL